MQNTGKEAKCSLNLDECFAYGSAYMAAYLNPSTRVNLTVKDVSPYSVEAEWNEEEPQKKELFEQFSEVPSSTTLELKVKGQTEVSIKSNDDVICVVNIETGVEDEVAVNLNVKLTQSSIIEVETASYKFDDKEKAAKVTVTQKEGMSDEEIENLRKIEDMFEASDLAEEKLDNTKNSLQSLYFTLLNDLRDNAQYINEDQLKEAQEKVNEVMAWYDEKDFEIEKLPIEEYENRIKELKEYSDPIENRIKTLKKAKEDLIPSLLKRVDTILKETENIQDENFQKINSEGAQLKEEFTNMSENMKNLPKDFDVNDLSKKVAFLEGQYKAQKQQSDWRAQQKRNDEELIRRRKQANEEEEMRKRIKEQQLRRQELENEEEEEQIDPFSLLFGQPIHRRQKLRRKQYDPEEEERKRRIEIERQREAQREAERRAELQRRAEEQRRMQLAEEQRRRRSEPWGLQDEDDDQSNDSYNQDEEYENPWNPYANQFYRRRNQQQQARQQQQQREQQLRQQQLREQQLRQQQLRQQQQREQQLRAQQQREQQLREQQLREQQLREQRERERELYERQLYEQQQREEQARRQQLREQQLREQQQRQAFEDGWGDPFSWGDPTPRPQPRRRVQQQQQQRPQRRVYPQDIWGNPWGNSGWRDPFF